MVDDILHFKAGKHTAWKAWSHWIFKDGAFSVNCTGKPSSRVAVDMAFQQTINTEAKIAGKVSWHLQILIGCWQMASYYQHKDLNNERPFWDDRNKEL